MTTYKHPRGKTYYYDFWWKPPGAAKSRRYQGSTGQLTKEDADLVEGKIKIQVRQEAFGIAPADRLRTPSFTTWAAVHLAHVRKKGRVTRLDAFEENLRLVLQFFGKRPTKLPDVSKVPSQWRQQIAAAVKRAEAAPYHDLRLLDPITEPKWIERFEDWMTDLGLSGPRKNHYRSAMSGMYRTALLPTYRKQANVTTNPFLNIERDHVPAREATLTLEQLRALVTAAAPHLGMAMAIAAYAPELRAASILSLRWRENLNPELTRIVVQQHKTRSRTQKPQIVPVSLPLRALLDWWRQQNSAAKHVITYHDEPITRLGTAMRSAVTRANKALPKAQRIVYGTRLDGITFHSIRHTMATLLAEWGEAEAIRKLLMGHQSLATTQKYTHMAATAKEAPLSRVAERLQLEDAVQGLVQNESEQTEGKSKYFKQARAALSKRHIAVKR